MKRQWFNVIKNVFAFTLAITLAFAPGLNMAMGFSDENSQIDAIGSSVREEDSTNDFIGGNEEDDPVQVDTNAVLRTFMPLGTSIRTPNGSVTIGGTENLNGRTLSANEFEFVLEDESGAIIETVKNAADGAFSFSAINYAPGDAGTYIYTVYEKSGALSGVTYDDTVYTVTVEVSDTGGVVTSAITDISDDKGGSGLTAITFNNTYTPRDVSGLIRFFNGKLTRGTMELTGDDIVFTNAAYTFTIEWESIDLNELYYAGDSFTLTLKTFVDTDQRFYYGFHSTTIPLVDGNGVEWGRLSIPWNSDTATVTFNDKVKSKQNVGGTFSFLGVFSETEKGKPIKWEFSFGGSVKYEYEGTSNGPPTGYNGYTTINNNKYGLYYSADNSTWSIQINMKHESWSGQVTVTDIMPAGLKMRSYPGTQSSIWMDVYRGFYGNTGWETYNSLGNTYMNYYIGVTVADYKTMREDYIEIIRAEQTLGHTNLWYDKGDGKGYVETGYTLNSSHLTGAYSYTNFMHDVMRGAKWTPSEADRDLCDQADVGKYKYLSPYTAGFAPGTNIDENGFTLVFPDGELDGKCIDIYYGTKTATLLPPEKFTNTVKINGDDVDTSASYSVTVSGTATIRGENGKIWIHKYDSTETVSIPNVGFTLKKTDGSNTYTETAATDFAGIAEFTLAYPYVGEYILTETNPPAGYKPAPPIKIVLDTESAIEIVSATVNGSSAEIAGAGRIAQPQILIVYNTPLGSIKLTKQDSVTGSPLEGVVFLLYRGVGASREYYKEKDASGNITWTSDKDQAFKFTSNSGGIIEITDLPYGNYSLEELSTLPGYEPLANARNVTVNSAVVETTINNTYAASGSIALGGTKSLSGRALAANEFEFVLEENGSTIDTVKNAANGTFSFPAITYTLADKGIHSYTVSEVGGSLSGVTYDSTVYTVTVKVSDQGGGVLKAEITDITDSKGRTGLPAITFNNEYKAGGNITLSGTKNLSGRTLLANEFEFAIGENGATIKTVQNTANGNFSFTAIGYSLADVGTHTYTVSEVSGALSGVTYDVTVYTVTVEVSDQGGGVLKAEITDISDSKGRTGLSAITFNNEYKAGGSITLSGTKNLSGRALVDGEFSFKLKEGNNEIATVSNVGGAFTFPAINYSLADVGDHTYNVTEVSGALSGVTYDDTVYTVKVEVSDKGDGTLKVDATEIKAGATVVQEIVFNNTYYYIPETSTPGNPSVDVPVPYTTPNNERIGNPPAPLSNLPGLFAILDEKTPLSDHPATGASRTLQSVGMFACLSILAGIAVLFLKKDEY